MKVLYILNESLFYKRMTLYSIHTLRKYEPKIPVEILLVKDGGVNSRNVGCYEQYDWGLGFINHDTFLHACRNLDVSVVETEFDNGSETGFHSSLRGAFVDVKGEDIFLMDSDTFFFAPFAHLFDHLREYDIVADKCAWSWAGGRLPLEQGDFIQFNSGVVLFRGGLLQEYGKVVHQYCADIRTHRHRLGVMMDDYEKKVAPTAQVQLGREEMGFSAWVVENGLKYRYFDEHEVQTCELRGRVMPSIFHTMTGHWGKYWAKFFLKMEYQHPVRWTGRPNLSGRAKIIGA